MVASLEPCCCSSNCNTQMTSIVIGCCQKKQTASHEEDSKFELKLLSSLPDEMLLEVLIRLPREKVAIYKLVCRRWCSLISSSHFISKLISLYRQRYSADTPNSFTLVFQHEVTAPLPDGFIKHLNLVEAVSNHPKLSISYKNNFVTLDFLPRFTPKQEGSDISFIYRESVPIRVKASCHDLLLCSRFSTYYVVNLLTGQWIVLPTFPPFNEEIHESKSLTLGQKPGILCYKDEKDNNGDGWYRFKVILVPKTLIYYSPENLRKRNTSGPPDVLSSKYSIKIFCSETRQWTKVIVDWYPLNLNYCLWYCPILSFDRMVHWLIGRSLVSLDLFSGDHTLSLSHVIKLPDEFVIDESLCFGLCVGRLRVACCVNKEGSGHVIHIWELEDWSSGSWSLTHKIVVSKLKFRSCLLGLVAFHPYQRDIIFLREVLKIYLFNMRTGKLKLCRKLGKGFKSGVHVDVVPPLLHQWFPTPVPSPPPVLDTY